MTTRDVDGKAAIVTGAGHGIGRVIAASLAAAGARVAVLDTDAAAAAKVASTLDGALAVPVDVADEIEVDRTIATVADTFGGLDILVNNAAITGTGRSGPLGGRVLDLPIAQWRRVIDVNLTGAFICAQSAARQMARGPGGTIVNVASVQALVPTDGSIDYGVSKAGLVMLTRCLAGELAPYRIRVNAVAPGPVLADGEQAGHEPDTLSGQWITPRQVADVVLFLVSEQALNGQVVAVDDGVSLRFRHPPRREHGADR